MKQIISLQHPLVKRLAKLNSDRSLRYEEKSVVVEGIKLVEELKGSLKRVLVTDPSLAPPGVETYLVSNEVIGKIAGSKHPEGIVAEVEMPVFRLPISCRYLLVLDGVSDPGNLGTLLRSALALGWEGAYLLGNCCDPFNDKAIRAAKGATFRLPIQKGSFTEFSGVVKERALIPLVATLEGESIKTLHAAQRIALILGSESHGPSKEVVEFAKKITIPITNMESLNVASAGAILMYTLLTRI